MGFDYYVYEIYDELGIMYIGKGRFGRMYEHEAQAVRKVESNRKKGLLPYTGLTDFQLRLYKASMNNTLGYRKVFSTPDESEALIQETYRIQTTTGLLNKVGNREARERGYYKPSSNKEQRRRSEQRKRFIKGTSNRKGV
jgi:hypothetical protein